MTYYWAPGPEEWDRVVASAYKSKVIGLDTEFYQVDTSKESVFGRGRVHIWSLAVFHGGLHPRGYQRAYGTVLPADALDYPGIAGLLGDDGITKAVHNLPVDQHALANRGVRLSGGVNTLSMARWYWPDLVPSSGGPGFGLKSLKVVLLGKKPGPHYKDVFREEYDDVKVRVTKVRSCAGCSDPKCRRRTDGHMGQWTLVEQPIITRKERAVPLEAVVEGHHLWDVAREYAAEDAVDALELWSLCQAQQSTRPMPWPPVTFGLTAD